MSLSNVDVETGEVVTVLSEQEARELTEQIADGLGEVWQLIKRAYLGRAWVPMGYGSWDEYVDGAFGVTRLRLPREDRQAAVHSLRQAGLSIRGTAAALGVSTTTVQKDEQVCHSATPDDGPTEPDIAPTPTTGTDGKTYTSKTKTETNTVTTAFKTGQAKKSHDPTGDMIAHNREHDPETRRRWFNSTVRGFLMSEARTLIDDFDAAEAGASIAKNETVMALSDAHDLMAWLETFIQTIESPGATVTNLRGVQ